MEDLRAGLVLGDEGRGCAPPTPPLLSPPGTVPPRTGGQPRLPLRQAVDPVLFGRQRRHPSRASSGVGEGETRDLQMRPRRWRRDSGLGAVHHPPALLVCPGVLPYIPCAPRRRSTWRGGRVWFRPPCRCHRRRHLPLDLRLASGGGGAGTRTPLAAARAIAATHCERLRPDARTRA